MADAVEDSLATGRHLLVQAGTGTGKSLGYLAPVLVRLAGSRERIVIATATLALQSQLADNDIPAALDAVQQTTGKRPRHAVLKGRTNYACLLRARDGGETDHSPLPSAADLVDTIPPSPRRTPESPRRREGQPLLEIGQSQVASGALADR